MSSPIPSLRTFSCALLLVLAAIARAQSTLPPERVPLDSLAAFRPTAANWRIAGGVGGNPRVDKSLVALDGTGVLVCSATADARGQLLTTWEHGDLDLDVDVLLLPGADSGLYLQGRYEVQVRDSWAKKEMTASDNAGVLPAYDDTKPAGQKNTGGSAPKANASRAPGLWQHFHVEFVAPRFDDAGKKTKNARIVRVLLNDFLVQENVEFAGATRGGAYTDEAPLGPLMLQGNNLIPGHAFRNLTVKRYGADRVTTENLAYKLYTENLKSIGSYDKDTPKSSGVPARFAHTAVEKSGKFALVFTGSLIIPRAGEYRFAAESGGRTRLLVDGREVVIPLDRGGQPGLVTLTAGTHDFRLDFLQNGNGRPSLELLAEGPGIPPHPVTVRDREPRGTPAARGKPILVEPKDRVLLQRGFVPYDPRKRLYAASVGSPAGVHFAYDFETAAILRVWRGSFLNTGEMWDGRGEPQLARANGPALTFNAKPAVALIEFAANGAWPEAPENLWSSQGYVLEPDGTPVFLSTLSEISIRDRLAPTADARGLTRTLQLKGSLPSWSAWVLLADAESITPQPDGHGWIIGDRAWYLDWPADAAQSAVIRTVAGRQQLAVPLTSSTLEKPIRYSIVW